MRLYVQKWQLNTDSVTKAIGMSGFVAECTKRLISKNFPAQRFQIGPWMVIYVKILVTKLIRWAKFCKGYVALASSRNQTFQTCNWFHWS
jgi:hypothetical protein